MQRNPSRDAAAWRHHWNQWKNPVFKAVMEKRLREGLAHGFREAHLQAFLGGDVPVFLARISRPLFVVLYAIEQGGKLDLPEARILRTVESVLSQLHQRPESLEQHRKTIISATHAAERLIPALNIWHLAKGDFLIEQQMQAWRKQKT